MIVYVIAYTFGGGTDVGDLIQSVATDEATAMRLARETAATFCDDGVPLDEWEYDVFIPPAGHRLKKIERWDHSIETVRIIAIEAEGAPC